ncbi:polysaccharide pyruvyl transferase family protein [Alkalihalobacterium alkalinitrilicum]|uniref:polysaccharide pyruvyl transferase family protein n=1 Tax=Alkalihalobacterium alkalinitrilicum TaxID=427920 RepID=UPI001303D7F4|nr:polysaccharide pyruvyl transferase family protein [Alkalihalobacterium alkalinitrilicum]
MWNHVKLIQELKSILPFGLKLLIIRILVAAQYIFYAIFPQKVEAVDQSKRKIYVLLSTDYSNLGDHAMTYAHIKLLKENYPEAQIIEVLVSDTLKKIKDLQSIIGPEDVLTLKGGGNIGLEYFREELYRRILIKKFNKNKIILFPQTVYFPDTNKGKREFKNTMTIFNSHPQFYTFIRDKISFDLVKKYLGERVFLIPDIAMSLGDLEIKMERKGATICLRDDKEGVYTKKQKEMIISSTKKHYEKINITDTITNYPISIEQRENELYKIWNLFSASELIITDRLHGMIFAAITSTPCVVFGTYNHKLIGQYKWLEHLDYIRFTKCDESEINTAIKELQDIKNVHFNIDSKYYKKITELI